MRVISREELESMGLGSNTPEFIKEVKAWRREHPCSPPVNAGMTYEQAYGEEVAKRMKSERSVSMRERMKGRTPWNKGKKCPRTYIPTPEHCRNISLAKKGVKQTPQHTLNHANAIRGRAPWNKGKKCPR